MGLHILKVDDEIDMQDGRHRVVKVTPSRIAVVPVNKKRITVKGRAFEAEGRLVNIAANYEGIAYRLNRKIRVIGRDDFRKIKASRENHGAT